jgi:hypothetical protein
MRPSAIRERLVGYLRKHRSMALVALGTLLMATSVFWEYVRMRPDYLNIVTPWSQRGYELTQGRVIAAIALVVLVLAILLTTNIVKETLPHSVAVAAAVTAGAVVLTILADARPIVPSWPITWSLALLTALAGLAVITGLLPQKLDAKWRRLTKTGSFFVLFLGCGLLLYGPVLSGTETPAWVVVLIAFVLIDVMVLTRSPEALSSYRLLINVHVVGWLVAITSAASIRTTLRGLQALEPNGAAELRDIQITSGMLIAWLGGLIAFAGVVALWANRRDHINATVRSERQLEAARKSAEELGTAL